MTLATGQIGILPGDSESTLDWRNEGDRLLRQREIQPAIAHFQHAAEHYPEDASAWLGLGQAYLTQGDLDSACTAFEMSLSLDSTSYWTPRLLFFAEAVRGNSVGGLSLVPLIQGDAFLDDYGLLLEAMLFREELWEDKRKRMKVWHQSVGLRDMITLFCLRLMLSFPRGLFVQAAADAIWSGKYQLRNDAWLEVILRDRLRFLGHRKHENLVRLCSLALSVSENGAAAAIAIEGGKQYPRKAVFSLLGGHAQFQCGDFPGASRKYQAAKFTDPGDWRGWLQLGASCLWTSDSPKSSEIFREANQRFPGNPMAKFLSQVPTQVLERLIHSEGVSVRGNVYPAGIPQSEIPDFNPKVQWDQTPWMEEIACIAVIRKERKKHRPVLKHRHPCSSCPACASSSIQSFFLNRASAMSLSRCTHCGHVFADPMPTAEGLKLLYGHGYFDRSWSTFPELVTRLIKDGVSPLPTYPIFTRLQDWLARIDPAWWGEGGLGSQALDLGCADGAFMVGLRNRGWKVMGQDVTDRFASYYETIGIPFQGGPSTDISIEESSIDLCTMTHVIEHLSDPAEVLRGIHSWLKPGGRLLLMTPCCGTLTAWLGGKQWFYMTEHVHFFSPQSLMSLGRRLGFQPLYWRTRVGIQHETPFRAWRRQLMGGPIEKLFEALGHGDVIELVLSKEGSSTSSGNSIPAGGS